ncbi:MauE/DoxX family redox-associated membrane protein [Jiangella anatolica]|uniref:Methylamine utilisation protein MauE domain-containing protein n=1 Tax=Jiangella anatolica TaxID=2670374 RepID=A0A2W2B014_9ACTN|nr:MauE/DoxX family redox-associated membrane protein [Jiangella anatolica]PZF80775.1 hypothetical protein C1I92_24350 [Jiangella anatolica]
MIAFVAELARWALVLVFAAAVIGKLVWPDGLSGLAATLRAGLHVPARLAGPAAVALLTAEAAVAGLVAVPATATAGLLAAGALSAGLTAGTIVLARRADALPCRCFGAGSAPVGWTTVLRNAGLTALAGAALALAGRTDVGGTGAGDAAVGGTGAATSLLAAVTAAALLLAARRVALHPPQQHPPVDGRRAGHPEEHPVELPPNGPELGAPAPAVPGVPPPRAGGLRLVAFASATCRACRDGLPRLAAYARLLGGADRVVVAIVGDPAAGTDIETAVAGVAHVLVGDRAAGLADVYGIAVFPTYVLVTGDGLVEAVAPSVDELPRPVR